MAEIIMRCLSQQNYLLCIFCICLLTAVGSLTCLGRVWVGGLGVDALVVFHILEGKVHQTSSTPMVALGFAIDINEIYMRFFNSSC